jgi:hypothetical protein
LFFRGLVAGPADLASPSISASSSPSRGSGGQQRWL